MTEIETVARELGESEITLQTGPKQLEAIGLYEMLGYTHIEPFGPYLGLDTMVFLAKELWPPPRKPRRNRRIVRSQI